MEKTQNCVWKFNVQLKEKLKGENIYTRHQKFRVKTYLCYILSINKKYGKRGRSGLGSCLILLPSVL